MSGVDKKPEEGYPGKSERGGELSKRKKVKWEMGSRGETECLKQSEAKMREGEAEKGREMGKRPGVRRVRWRRKYGGRRSGPISL